MTAKASFSLSPPRPACRRSLSSTTGVSISSKPYEENVERMTPSTRSRRALSAGRKSRMPRGGFTGEAMARFSQTAPCSPASAVRATGPRASLLRCADVLPQSAQGAAQRPLGVEPLLARGGDDREQIGAELLLRRGDRRGGCGAPRPSRHARGACRRARAPAWPDGMPSSTLVRSGFSTALSWSQFAMTASAVSATASPNTCGCRPIIFAVIPAATSSSVNRPSSAAMSAWKSTW